jgi:hypothetical protein
MCSLDCVTFLIALSLPANVFAVLGQKYATFGGDGKQADERFK